MKFTKKGRKLSEYGKNANNKEKNDMMDKFTEGYMAAVQGDYEKSYAILDELKEKYPDKFNDEIENSFHNKMDPIDYNFAMNRVSFNFNQAEKSFHETNEYTGLPDGKNYVYDMAKLDYHKFSNSIDKFNDNLPSFMELAKQLILMDDDPNYVSLDSVIFQALGVRLNYIKEYESAKYYLIQSILIEKFNHHSYQELGDCHRFQGNYDFALKHYQKALEIKELGKPIKGIDVDNMDSDVAEYYYGIGMSYIGLNQHSVALDYFVKAKNLKESKYFGYTLEGFKDWHELISSTQKIQNEFNKLKSPSDEDYDIAINSIELLNEKLRVLANKYFEELESQLTLIPFYASLDETSRKFFLTAEFLYTTIPINSDYAPAMVEYCKIVESEMQKKFVAKLEAWTTANKKNIQTGPNRNTDINKFKNICLGNFQYLLKDKEVQLFIKESFNNYSDYLIDELPKMLSEIVKYRNSSAHIHTSTKEKVEYVRNILLNNKTLEIISKLVS